MPAVLWIAVLLALFAQALNPSPRELLNAERPLGTADIASVLDASRTAIAGKTFRLSVASSGTGPEVLMGTAGRPRMIRYTIGFISGIVGIMGGGTSGQTVTRSEWHEDLIQILDYTGRPARRCDGPTVLGELVVEYEHRSSTNAWSVMAQAGTAPIVAAPAYAPLFEMLRGATPVTSGDRQQIGGRWARAFVAPWTPRLADRRKLSSRGIRSRTSWAFRRRTTRPRRCGSMRRRCSPCAGKRARAGTTSC